MNVKIWERPERVLAALNGTHYRWGTPWNEEFRSRLRQLIDEWLDTGIEDEAVQKYKDHTDRETGHRPKRYAFGTEVPAQRNIARAANGQVAIDYLESHPPRLLRPIRNGQLLFAFGSAHCETADEEAVQLFCVVLLSDWGARLAKCRYAPCGRYFLPPRLGKKYRNGTFCSRRHSQRASAKAATRRLRQRLDTDLVEQAGRELRRLRAADASWSQDRNLKTRLVARLNKHLGKQAKQQHRPLVTRGWVTRNRARIEAQRATDP